VIPMTRRELVVQICSSSHHVRFRIGQVGKVRMQHWLLGFTMVMLWTFSGRTATAETFFIRPQPQTDVFEFGSIRPDAADLAGMQRGRWNTSLTTTYFNKWYGSFHLRRTRADQGRDRDPVVEADTRDVEMRFPDDDIFLIDVEGWRADLVTTYGLPRSMALTMRVPWISIGAPNWDSVGEAFHSVIEPPEDYARDSFRRGATLLYVRSSESRIYRDEELDRSGIGDVSLTLSGSGGELFAASNRWGFTVQAPTGQENTLQGSGGWDLAAAWRADWLRGRAHYHAAIGFTALDSSGDFLGSPRNDTYHLSGGASRQIRAVNVQMRARFDSSPYADSTKWSISKPSLVYTLGFVIPRGKHWFGFDIGEELIPQTGLDADYSFQFSLGTTGR